MRDCLNFICNNAMVLTFGIGILCLVVTTIHNAIEDHRWWKKHWEEEEKERRKASFKIITLKNWE